MRLLKNYVNPSGDGSNIKIGLVGASSWKRYLFRNFQTLGTSAVFTNIEPGARERATQALTYGELLLLYHSKRRDSGSMVTRWGGFRRPFRSPQVRSYP